MFLCRSLGRAVTARGLCSLQVPAANRLRDVTVTLHKVHRLHTSRVLCVTASKGHVTNANTVKGQEGDSCLHQEWGWTRGFAADWQHWDRIATIATSLSKSSQAGHLLSSSTGSVFRLHVTRKVAGGDVCSGGHFSPHLSSRSMQTRTASSSAATKQREASDEQQPRSEGDKGDEEVLKNSPPSTEKDSVNPAPDPEGGKPNKTQQLKKVFKEYGAVGVSFHVCISLMSLGMFYLLVSSGIDMAALLCKMGFSETVVKSKMAAGTSTFVLAYAVHKLFAPVRISVTLVSVPLIVRHFRKIGLFKAPPAAP